MMVALLYCVVVGVDFIGDNVMVLDTLCTSALRCRTLWLLIFVCEYSRWPLPGEGPNGMETMSWVCNRDLTVECLGNEESKHGDETTIANVETKRREQSVETKRGA